MSNIAIRSIPRNSQRGVLFDRTGFWFGVFDDKKGTLFPTHWHDYFELEIILSGTLKYTFNSVTTTAVPGNTFLLNTPDNHAIEYLEDTRMINIRFKQSVIPDYLSDILSTQYNIHCFFDESELSYIRHLAEKAESELKYNDIFSNEIIKNIICEIIFMILRKCGFNDGTTQPHTIQKAISYMQKNYKKNISIVDMAGKLGMSANHLGKIFKDNIGMSFNEYLNILRLKRASDILLTTDRPIDDIAQASGYNSTQYFIYTFKRYMNTTPAKYRITQKGVIPENIP